MRPGSAEDMPQLVELWRNEVAVGRQDMAPRERWIRGMLAHFDWETKSRVLEDGNGLAGAVFVVARPSPGGLFATVNAAGRGDRFADMARWGVQFARATGARIVQLTVGKGQGDGLAEAGLEAVRPWWRMDRSLLDRLPDVEAVAGYELVDGSGVAPGAWADMFNSTFADHWRFVPRGELEIMSGRSPELALMAVTTADRSPAALTLGDVETLDGDLRPQPVGMISSVGTLPAHRRRGLAGWLVADMARRLRDAGARHASLYVDGNNAHRAHEVYRRLGFRVAFEAEVWEAVFP